MTGFQLVIGVEDEGQAKLTWLVSDGDAPDQLCSYLVPNQLLESKANDVRACLARFANNVNERSLAGQRPDYARFLPELATEGDRLHKLLFRGLTDQDKTNARITRQILEEAAGERSKFVVRCDHPLHIPWSFVGALPAQPFAEPTTIEDEIALFDHFWGSRFRLSVRFTSNFPVRRRAAYAREEFRLLSMVNRDELSRALGAIPCEIERTSIETRLHRLLELVVRDATEWAAGKARWDETRENPRALYVFGHCDGTALYLREDGETDGSLSVADFVTDWQEGSGPPTLVFFNGCRSAAGSGYLSFLQNSWQSGFRGCIATEANIPNAFALRYGVCFMERLCFEGASVGEVFEELRHSPSLFPLSLLYGCYADTEFRVAPALADA